MENNKNRRFIAKLKKLEGKYGEFLKVVVNNDSPKNPDGTPNRYYQGRLVWLDALTGEKFLIKSISIRGTSEKSKELGYTNTLTLDLDNDYEVQKLS